VCKLGVVVVASPADHIVDGKGAAEARAVVKQRRPRDPVLAWVPRAVTSNRRSVREALLLLVGEELVEGYVGQVDAETRPALPRQLLLGGLRRREGIEPG
jgi:hypothetical protein